MGTELRDNEPRGKDCLTRGSKSRGSAVCSGKWVLVILALDCNGLLYLDAFSLLQVFQRLNEQIVVKRIWVVKVVLVLARPDVLLLI